jgi:hypothetical protein
MSQRDSPPRSAPLPRRIGQTTYGSDGSITRLPGRPAVIPPGARLIEVSGYSSLSAPPSSVGDIETDQLPETTYQSDDHMSSPVNFNGRPSQLDDVLTHVTIRFLTDPTITHDDARKSAILAATFRGDALTWLTRQMRVKTDILDDYNGFVNLLKLTFQASPETQQQQAELKLRSLRQKGSAQSYALVFDSLADTLHLGTDARKAAFIQGLKHQVRVALLAGQDNESSYGDLRTAAIRIDDGLYSLKKQYNRQGTGDNKKRTGKPIKRED